MIPLQQCGYCGNYFTSEDRHDCKMSNEKLFEEIEKERKEIIKLKKELEKIKQLIK